MSRHDDRVTIRQMLDAACEAHAMCQGRSRVDLDRERMLDLALTRLMEIVGEAATRVSPEFQAAHPDIPWAQVIGLRNRLIHGYDAIDFDILWPIVTHDLPPLILLLENVLGGN
jgi:uncharacterized protein with HEPN domain